MPSRQFIFSFMGVFVTLSLYSFVVWALLLADIMHAEMGNIWVEEANIRMPWFYIAYALMAYVMVWIWKYGQEEKGLSEGFRYGLMLGILFGSAELIGYAVEPITMKGALMAFGIDVVMFALAGVVLAFVHKSEGAK